MNKLFSRSLLVSVAFSAAAQVACMAQVGDDPTNAGSNALTFGTGSSAPTGPYECPSYLPVVGYACTGDYSCSIANDCGSTTTATCVDGAWTVSGPDGCGSADKNHVAPGSSDCPLYAPKIGESCWILATASCPYKNDCFGADTYACVDGAWAETSTTCVAGWNAGTSSGTSDAGTADTAEADRATSEPGTSTCPAEIPGKRQGCQIEGEACSYDTNCGTATATCANGFWRVAAAKCAAPSKKAPSKKAPSKKK